MDLILHILGLCPDHQTHISLFDLWIVFDQFKIIIINYIKVLWYKI